MKSLVVAAVAALAIAAVGAANAQEDKAKAAGCMNCHAVDTKKVGPAFKDIAAKYKGQADAEAKLVGEITSGKGHPAVKATPDDVKTLVKWVLSM
jgi:cytochrome c